MGRRLRAESPAAASRARIRNRQYPSKALARLVTITAYAEKGLYAITGTKDRERCRYYGGVRKYGNHKDAKAVIDRNRYHALNRVFLLLSPPELPKYNGSVEAGIGTLKSRVFWGAARHDRPVHWTSDDVEAGVVQANAFVRKDGSCLLSPDQRWSLRVPIAQEERAAFSAAVQKRLAESRAELGLLPGLELTRQERNSVMRMALSQALVDQGLLQVRRRRFTPPFPLRFW